MQSSHQRPVLTYPLYGHDDESDIIVTLPQGRRERGMRSESITVSVTGLADVAEALDVAATVHLPDRATSPKVFAVGMPGGGYNRHYYDLRLDGLSGYSQAEYHTDRGWGFIACDP